MRILIVNPFGIGDVLFSTPLISNLREAMPDSSIGYICNIRAKDVLDGNPGVDEIFVFEKDEYRKLWQKAKFQCIKKFISFLGKIKKRRFDIAIDLSLGRHYSFFLWLIGIRKRIGYNYRNRGRFLTHRINISGYEDKPIADYYLSLLKFLNIASKQSQLKMNLPEEDRRWAVNFLRSNGVTEKGFIVGIIPAGGASWGRDFAYRHWPWESYAKLADKLISELNAKVIILGHSSEQDICQKMQTAMQRPSINACGKTTLKQFAAFLAKCKLVICNDGGPLHVAISQGVLTVSIFGPVDERVYGPYPPGSGHIVITKDIGCRPCYKKFKLPLCRYDRQCIRSISSDEVFKVIKDNLSRKRIK